MAFPPGPRDWTGGFRLLRRIKRDVLGFYQEMQRTYGDVVAMRLGPYLDFTFFHPDAIKEILVTKAKLFVKMPRQRNVLAQWNGNGLLLSEGDFWLRQRRLVQPAFRQSRFAGYAQVMAAEAERLADAWEARLKREADPTVDVAPAMVDLTLAVIGQVFFSADLHAAARGLGQAVDELSQVALREFQQPFSPPRWWPSPANRRKWAAARTLDAFIRGMIRQRRAEGNPDKGDLLSMLLLAVDEEGDGGPMTDEQARDEAVGLFLAGHDTTAAGLTWVFAMLAERPDLAARVRAEVKAAAGHRPLVFADLEKLPLLARVIQETLRLYPPAVGAFTRVPTEDTEIAGWQLKRGNLVRIFSFITHRDPRWWPEPLRFDPDRFLPGAAGARPQFSYLPFGGGPRICIGREFASAEMALIVATLLRRFELAMPPDAGPTELELKLSLWPKGGLRLALRAARGS